jgi:hypothetical protein
MVVVNRLQGGATRLVYNRRMKRLALSLLGGFLLPFLYAIIVGPLTQYIQSYRTLNFFATVPVRWPILIFYWLGELPSESELLLLLYIVGCNVIFYGSLIYFVLFALSKRKKTSPLPPAPDNTGTANVPTSPRKVSRLGSSREI